MREAAPKRAAYLAQQAAAAQGGGERRASWRLKLFVALVIVVAAAGAAGYVLVIEPRLDRHALLGQAGRPRAAAFGDGVIALFDDVDVEKRDREDPRRDRRIDRTRVTVVDVATGARVAQHLFDAGNGCVPASPGRVWCDLGALALHDARTFARLARADALVAKAGLGRLVGQRWRVDGATATWALDDGRAALVDAATLAARVTDRVPAELRPDALMGLAPRDGSLTLPRECV